MLCQKKLKLSPGSIFINNGNADVDVTMVTTTQQQMTQSVSLCQEPIRVLNMY